MKVLLCGQVINSRTETIENYLKYRVHVLEVIGIVNPLLNAKGSHHTFYRFGTKEKEYAIPSFYVGNRRWLLPFILLFYYFMMVKEGCKSKKVTHIFIGISCLSALVGLTLKMLGKVKRVIYYCIDYYPQRTLLNKLTWRIDKLCAKHSLVTWDISPRIANARYIYSGLQPTSYKRDILPMMYGSDMLHKSSTFERYTLCFVGTLCWEQGFRLLFLTLPTLLHRFLSLKVRVIGSGAAAPQIANLFSGLPIIFHGFVKDNSTMLNILSHSAVGLALWTPESNAPYADPGKPKLYAFCGVPSIITANTAIADTMHSRQAAIKINYSENEFIEAVTKLLANTDRLMQYRANAYEFAQEYTTDKVLEPVWGRINEKTNLFSYSSNRDKGSQ